HDALPISLRAGLIAQDQAALLENFRVKPDFHQMPGQPLAVRRSISEPEARDRLITKAAICEIPARGSALGGRAELGLKKLGCLFVNLVERGAVPRLGVVSLIADPLAQGDSRLLGHAAQRLRESEVLDQHHKVEYVAARLAAKAVEDLFHRMDREGGSF